MLKIYIDGASLGNPGRSGVGYLIYKDNKLLKKKEVYLGIQTNNFAEYMALIFALIDVLRTDEEKCQVFSDSKLLCEQIKENFKVKNKNIYPLFTLAKTIITHFKEFEIFHIEREKNKQADKLARRATGFLV